MTILSPISVIVSYYPNRIRLIDIGNYVQLAQTVQAIASEFVVSGVNGKHKPLESPRYTAETLRDLYCKIILGGPQSQGDHSDKRGTSGHQSACLASSR
jgi:hypothetical protein